MFLLSVLLVASSIERPRVPLHFEPNQGQVAGETEWIAKAPGATLFIREHNYRIRNDDA
jgi:hypothetical protein